MRRPLHSHCFRHGVSWFAVLVVVLSVGCRDKAASDKAKVGAATGASGGFAMQVVAVPVREEPVVESVGLVGSVTANEFVEIKAESDGTVQEISFSEGQRVEK